MAFLKGTLLATCILFAVVLSYGQEFSTSYPYNLFTVSDGLAQMQVRAIYVDEHQRVWIGTQGGISVYDGTGIHTFKDAGLLAEQYVTSLISCDDILYGTTETQFFRYSGDKITFFELPKFSYTRKSFVELGDKNGYIWIKHHQHDILIFKQDRIVPVAEVYPQLANIRFKQVWGNPGWDHMYIFTHQNTLLKFDFDSGTLSIIETPFVPDEKIDPSQNRSAINPEICFYRSIGLEIQEIYRLVNDRLHLVAKYDQGSKVFIPLAEFAPEIIVGVKADLYLKSSSGYLPPQNLDFYHYRFVVNIPGKTFLATDSGFVVIHRNGLKNVRIPESDLPWAAVPVDTKNVLIGCYKNGLFKLDTETRKITRFKLPPLPESVPAEPQLLTNYGQNKDFVLFGSQNGFYMFSKKNGSVKFFQLTTAAEAFAYDDERKLFWVGSEYLFAFDPDMKKFTDTLQVSRKVLGNSNMNDLEITKDGNIWIAGKLGVQSIHQKSKKSRLYTYDEGNFPCFGAVSIARSENHIWVGGTCGLVQFDHNRNQFYSILPEIIDFRINQIQCLSDSILVIVGQNKLIILDINEQPFKVSYYFDERSGLKLYEPSENGMAVMNGNQLWLPSSHGVQKLDLARIELIRNKPAINVLSINGRTSHFTNDQQYKFIIDTEDAVLKLSVADHSGLPWQFRFKVNDGDFSGYHSSDELILRKLDNGINKILIEAACQLIDTESSISRQVLIQAYVPFWKRKTTLYTIYILTGLMFISVAGLLVAHRYRQLRTNNLQNQLIRNRLELIQAYFNPHFMFNALTVLQDVIMHNSREEGSKMVVRLSNIFRRILVQGKKNHKDNSLPFISLSEEIELIKDLAHLHNLQNDRKIQLVYEIGEDVLRRDPKIPSLTIQPFVENALKHAFNDKTKDCEIKILVKFKGKSLNIKVIDNGIGFLSKKERSPMSLGLQLAQERSELFKKLGIDYTFGITHNDPQGTIVNIITDYESSDN